MGFKINANGIKIEFKINSYKCSSEEIWDSKWCKCDFSFYSSEWLNYHKENDEVLLSCEVDELEERFTELLDNKLSEVKEIICIEPDFIFKLYPKRDLREDPSYTYIRPGYEIKDIYLEWRVYFWNNGLTDNYLTITLDRDEIILLRDYLLSVINS